MLRFLVTKCRIIIYSYVSSILSHGLNMAVPLGLFVWTFRVLSHVFLDTIH